SAWTDFSFRARAGPDDRPPGEGACETPRCPAPNPPSARSPPSHPPPAKTPATTLAAAPPPALTPHTTGSSPAAHPPPPRHRPGSWTTDTTTAPLLTSPPADYARRNGHNSTSNCPVSVRPLAWLHGQVGARGGDVAWIDPDASGDARPTRAIDGEHCTKSACRLA